MKPTRQGGAQVWTLALLVLTGCGDGVPESLSQMDPLSCGWSDIGSTDVVMSKHCAMTSTVVGGQTVVTVDGSACDAAKHGAACVVISEGQRARYWTRVGAWPEDVSTEWGDITEDGTCPLSCE